MLSMVCVSTYMHNVAGFNCLRNFVCVIAPAGFYFMFVSFLCVFSGHRDHLL